MRFKKNILIFAFLMLWFCARAEYAIDCGVEIIGNCGSGDFSPHYVMSNNHGVQTQSNAALLKIDMHRDLNMDKRFSFGYGASFIGGYSSKTGYQAYDLATSSMKEHKEGPSVAWIQELYAEIKYRSIFLNAGAKELGSKLLNDRLSSGDITLSANTRPKPGVRAGFVDPQNIPFTNGWVQIAGEIGFYKFTDSEWLKNHYNYRNYYLTTDFWFNYKYLYFVTKTSKPFSVTLGLQASCQFGGVKTPYKNGLQNGEALDMGPTFGTFVRSFIPGSGGSNPGDINYVEGNHVGSIDLMGRYRFKNGTEIKAYYQNPWEDGSALGKMNGFDGLYGVEYKSSLSKGIVTGAVVEYLDFRNQSGPIHWSPDDYPGTPIEGSATGADNYYNNYAYNGYQYYGMSIGSPIMKAPIYNTDGYMSFTDTRLRSVHLGVEGTPVNNLSYRLMFSYTKSWGTPFRPYSVTRENVSAMVECVYDWQKIPGFKVKGQIGFDKGQLLGDKFGALLSLSYQGLFRFCKK